MNAKQKQTHGPREVISLTNYTQLELYLAKFAAGSLGLVLLIGRHGTGKSESVRRSLAGTTDSPHCIEDGPTPALFIEGHMQPFGLYRHLWEYRDHPVVLDDLDRLYADPDCVRLLKPLCNTVRQKRLHWLTNITMNDNGVPATFSTTSRVILIANEWKSLNPNVRALEDRAIILHFDPPNHEVHRRVGEWFDDDEVYEFIASILNAIPAVSMRHYCKGSQLRQAGLRDWRTSLFQMVISNPRAGCLLALQQDTSLTTEKDRVDRFVAATGCSRATYFRMKARLIDLRVTRTPATRLD
jgi:hypothetical protein